MRLVSPPNSSFLPSSPPSLRQGATLSVIVRSIQRLKVPHNKITEEQQRGLYLEVRTIEEAVQQYALPVHDALIRQGYYDTPNPLIRLNNLMNAIALYPQRNDILYDLSTANQLLDSLIETVPPHLPFEKVIGNMVTSITNNPHLRGKFRYNPGTGFLLLDSQWDGKNLADSFFALAAKQAFNEAHQIEIEQKAYNLTISSALDDEEQKALKTDNAQNNFFSYLTQINPFGQLKKELPSWLARQETVESNSP